ncbi:MAG: FMN-binding protein [Patescibacteria group bacterium]|nr:FMN-binding protein [Patescibacteria group bacterium]MCL5224086.1 FMN-binding protein [Patescibacteria group bacterium]
MKKFLFSLGVITAFVLYALLSNDNQGSLTTSQQAIVPSSSDVVRPTSPASVTRSPAYKGGLFYGGVANAFYGNVQVAAAIKNGKLTDVQFLQYPNDNGHSLAVSGYALPILKQEAIQSQSANVDIVSGATETSLAYQQSLTSALSQAKN